LSKDASPWGSRDVGLERPDLFKRLKIMQDVDAILPDRLAACRPELINCCARAPDVTPHQSSLARTTPTRRAVVEAS
jgi:hypothetical protein